MKKVLFTGGSYAEVPLIRIAKEKGMFVITTGNDASGIGHRLADKYIKGDYSDKDFVCKIAEDENVDYIVSGCNDFAYLSTAYACEKLNLPGHDKYEIAKVMHHKDKFMNVAKSLGIRVPKTFKCKCWEDCLEAFKKLNLSAVLKPIDLTGGKGVKICTDIYELEKAYEETKKWTREKIVILEEYIKGTNHGASCIIKNGKVVFLFCDNEQYYINKYLVSGACYPSDVPQCAMLQIKKDIETIAQRLDLVDGLFHAQFIVDENKFPIIIDTCRRSPGDLYISFVKYATEINYPLEIFKAEIGEAVNDIYAPQYNCIARECIMTDSSGVFSKINIDKSISEDIIESVVWAKKGDIIDDYTKFKAGIVFIKNDNFIDLYAKVNKINELITIEKDLI